MTCKREQRGGGKGGRGWGRQCTTATQEIEAKTALQHNVDACDTNKETKIPEKKIRISKEKYSIWWEFFFKFLLHMLWTNSTIKNYVGVHACSLNL